MNVTDWQDWLAHPGTRAFVEHIKQEWGAGGKRFEGLIDRFADDLGAPEQNMRHIQQTAVARREILRLLDWPQEEIRRLKEQDKPVELGPREPMPVSLAGMSRRGGL